MSFERAFTEVKVLIEDFSNNENYYLSSSYAEAQVRQDFIDKFFTILGWDVAHNFQKNPFEQEVKVEKPQRQEGMQSQKRADYAFSLAPNFKQTQFFVEAKKPSRLLRQNRDDYFQTAKYGWNSQTGISVLTDFQEFVIIDCRFKPDFETILSNQIKYYSYRDFLDEEKFAEIYFLFSREAVAEGKLRTYIEQLPKPKVKGKQLKLFAGKYKPIDEDFLEYIDEIRKNLALAFYHNNPALEDYELTEATQRTVDRLVFMRFLEDKQIEPDDVMHHIATAQHPWQKFVETCKRFDAKYNGIIFKKHFIDDDFRGADEELFRNICQDLDHTNTPYDFNYIPIHILGNIYERFLGKVILIENRKATIELKPEVRKAGGVFYTPKYIVDYIVENTIGKLIEDKSPKQIAPLAFADIACGSGSFLIGVYEYLLDYHLKYYNQKPDEAKKAGCIYDPEKQIFVLSIMQKQQILTNNVFGVDIDQQATEVTQVSLFLKLLEDETMATATDMNVLFAEKILPDLSGNIKCGNSLIGWEILDGVLDFGQKELRKLNPFSFREAFPTVFANGGFDAIVGNPPYLKLTQNNTDTINLNYYKANYKSYSGGSSKNLFQLFIERCVMLNTSLFSFIVPEALLTSTSNGIVRKLLLENYNVNSLVVFDHFVFEDATIGTTIFVCDKNGKDKTGIYLLNSKQELVKTDTKIFKENNLPWEVSLNALEKDFLNRIDQECFVLSEFVKMSKGMVVKDRNAVLHPYPKENFLPFLLGNCMNRYILYYDKYANYNDLDIIGGTRDYRKQTTVPRVLIRRTGTKLCATYTEEIQLVESTLYIVTSDILNLKYLLSLLNSNFLNFYLKKRLLTNASGFPQVLMGQLEQLPIPKITPENQSLHDDLVKLVDQMLQAKQDEQHAKTDMDKTLATRRCDNLDSRINQIVYQLYQLTPEEMQLVEANT